MFITKFIEVAEYNNTTIGRGSNIILLFNSFNKFRSEPMLVLYPLLQETETTFSRHLEFQITLVV